MQDWFQVFVSINSDPEFLAFEGPRVNADAYVSKDKRRKIAGQTRTYRVEAL